MTRLSNQRLLLLFSGLVEGCWGDVKPCNPHVHRNESFEVTVMALADAGLAARSHSALGLPSCGLDDVHVGDKFAVTLQKPLTIETGDECNLFECPLSLPGPAMRYSEPQSIEGSLGYVCVSPTAKIELDDMCELGRIVWLYSYLDRALYSSTTTDNPFILLRGLTPEKNLLCPSLAARFPEAVPNQRTVCADQWIVELADKQSPSAL